MTDCIIHCEFLASKRFNSMEIAQHCNVPRGKRSVKYRGASPFPESSPAPRQSASFRGPPSLRDCTVTFSVAASSGLTGLLPVVFAFTLETTKWWLPSLSAGQSTHTRGPRHGGVPACGPAGLLTEGSPCGCAPPLPVGFLSTASVGLGHFGKSVSASVTIAFISRVTFYIFQLTDQSTLKHAVGWVSSDSLVIDY